MRAILLFLFFVGCGFETFEVPESQSLNESPTPTTTPLPGANDVPFDLVFENESPLILVSGQKVQLELTANLGQDRFYPHLRNTLQIPELKIDFPIQWYSENDQVASVSGDGLVSATKAGQTTLKATISKISTNLAIIVSDPPKITIREILFQKSFYDELQSFPLLFDVHYSDGSAKTKLIEDIVECEMELESSHPVVRITTDGWVIPVADGATNLEAICGEWVASATLRISGISRSGPTTPSGLSGSSQPSSSAPTVLLGLEITTQPVNWVVGGLHRLTATLRFETQTLSNVSTHFVTPSGEVQTLEWVSDNPGAVEIRGGTARLIRYGSATLRARVLGKEATLVVHVQQNRQDPRDPSDRFLNSNDRIIFTQGTNGGFGSASFPQIIYGPPQTGGTHVISLGGGGEILIELGGYTLIDGMGPDFTLFENPILSAAYGNFIERAEVSVSLDGRNFTAFPCNAFDPNRVFAGCAGLFPVNYAANPLDPTVSGGDSFDLGTLGMESARFILIKDKDTCRPGDVSYPLCGFAMKQGYDLDAIAIVNGTNQ